MITRRGLIRGLAGVATLAVAVPGHAVGVEPMRLVVTRYRAAPPGWPAGLRLTLAVLADPHVCYPWMTPDRITAISEFTNTLGADAVLLLGDYTAGHRWVRGHVPEPQIAAGFAALRAPLGVHAALGNHDWWDDPDAQRTGQGPIRMQQAFEAVGITVYHNRAAQLTKAGQPFWLAGLGDQLALRGRRGSGWRYRGVDDLPGTLAQITDDAPVVLMAHEPDVFLRIPQRVALTVSGHTHGGQIRMLSYSPVVPSRYGNRYAYGHVVEDDRHLIVSGGLGCSIAPVRLGLPPEIVLVELSA